MNRLYHAIEVGNVSHLKRIALFVQKL